MEGTWLTPPKALRVSSAGKVMVFIRDGHGVIMVDYVEEGHTINGAKERRRLYQEIVTKRSGKLT